MSLVWSWVHPVDYRRPRDECCRLIRIGPVFTDWAPVRRRILFVSLIHIVPQWWGIPSTSTAWLRFGEGISGFHSVNASGGDSSLKGTVELAAEPVWTGHPRCGSRVADLQWGLRPVFSAFLSLSQCQGTVYRIRTRQGESGLVRRGAYREASLLKSMMTMKI